VRTVSVTVVPAGPLMSATASSEVIPSSDRPSTATIRSPLRRPARSAGEPSKIVAIFSPRRTSCTVMPTPSNWPPLTSWKC
jgi:hypothetical protein